MTFHLTDEILKDVENYAARGLTQEEIADNLGIHFATLYRKKKSSSQFCEAIKRGKSKGKSFVKNQLFEKIRSGNVAAIIFYLKTQCGWKEVEGREVSGKEGAAIEQSLTFPEMDRKISDMLEEGQINGSRCTDS